MRGSASLQFRTSQVGRSMVRPYQHNASNERIPLKRDV